MIVRPRRANRVPCTTLVRSDRLEKPFVIPSSVEGIPNVSSAVGVDKMLLVGIVENRHEYVSRPQVPVPVDLLEVPLVIGLSIEGIPKSSRSVFPHKMLLIME